MGNAFTKGPWKAELGSIHHSECIVITADHAGMTSNTPLANLATFDDACWNDARLIAAAPTMFSLIEKKAKEGHHDCISFMEAFNVCT